MLSNCEGDVTKYVSKNVKNINMLPSDVFL